MIDRRSVLAAFAGSTLATSACAGPRPGPDGAVEIAYGPHPRQRFDLYPQAGLKNAPVLLFVHGGGWAAGSRKGVHALPDYARRHGFLLASTGYRFAPEADAGDAARDVSNAVRRLWREAPRLGGDPDRVVLVGHSSGAHLAALAAVGPRQLGNRRTRLAGVISLDTAAFDVVEAMARMGVGRVSPLPPIPQMFVNAFGDQAEALSPMRLVRPGVRYPPFLLFHVAQTFAGEQSARFATLLRAGGNAAEVVASADTHMTLNTGFGAPGDPEGERAARFVRTGEL
jgi:acetyl esterase/lipase